MHYFGKWDDLDAYNQRKDDPHAGRRPRQHIQGITVKELANAFLAAKQALVDSGELLARTWSDYKFPVGMETSISPSEEPEHAIKCEARAR